MGPIIRRSIAALLVISAIILAALPAPSAQAYSERGDYVLDGSTVVSYKGDDSEVTLPNTITSVGKDAFAGNKNLTKVVIPDSVRTIDFSAFENCINLQKAVIGQGVRTIGSSAFSGCTLLHSVNIPERCDSIGSGVFAGCNNLASVDVHPDNLYFVCNDGVLYSRDGYTLVQYLPGRARVGYSMPSQVHEIGEYAFWGAYNLTDVIISPNVEEIPEYAFSNCSGLTNVVMPTSVESLMAFSFADCPSLRSIAIPESVGYIDDRAFYQSNGTKICFVDDAGNTTSVINPDQLAAVSAEAVASGADGVSSPSEVVSGAVAPDPTESVDTNSSETAMASDGFDSANDTDSTDNVNISDPTSYSGNEAWNRNLLSRDFSDNTFDNELGSSMVIGGNAVMIMSPDMPVRGYQIEDAELEDSVGMGNSSSSDVQITPEGKLKNRTFYQDNSLENESVSTSVKSVGDFAYARSSVKSILIPDSVSSIGYGAFYCCPNLSDVHIADSVQSIELGAFDNTPWLMNWKQAQDGKSFLTVGDGILLAYKGEGGNISIPEGVKTIGPGCFAGNTSISGVKVPSSVRTIGEDAFNGCIKLRELTLSEGLKNIEDRAFKDTNLSFLQIPDSVETIGLGAFDLTGTGNHLNTVILQGNNMPNCAYKPTATRLSSDNLRTKVFENIDNLIVGKDADIHSGTIADPSYYGFRGQVYCISGDSFEGKPLLELIQATQEPDVNGNVNISATIQLGDDSYLMGGAREHAFDSYLTWPEWCARKPTSVSVDGNASESLNALLSNVSQNLPETLESTDDGIIVHLSGTDFAEDSHGIAKLPGEHGRLECDVFEDHNLEKLIKDSYRSAKGKSMDGRLVPLSLTCTQYPSAVPINKFGSGKMEMSISIPQALKDAPSVYGGALNEDGDWEDVAVTVDSANNMLTFVAGHSGVFALFGGTQSDALNVSEDVETQTLEVLVNQQPENLTNLSQTGIVNTLHKDVGGIKAKWFVIVIMLSMAAILVLYKSKNKVKTK